MNEHEERLRAMSEDRGDTWDLSDNDQAACLAGAEALRRIEAYDKAWDAYETSPHGGTFTAMMNARAEMFALLATAVTR